MADTLACDVAIIGSGPAGLGAAIALRQRGVGRVVIFEREPEIGGVPRHCAHPPYGLREFGRLMTGPSYARRLHDLAARHGAEFCTRSSVVALEPNGRLKVATPEKILSVAARRTLLATGAREAPRSARLVSGDRPLGVINTGALQACLYLEHMKPAFSRPVIVGTELVGLSALWTCMRHGIRPAAIIESADRPVARWPLGLFPDFLRVPIHLSARLTKIVGAKRVEQVHILSNTGKTLEIQCDGVIFTGSFVPEASLMRASGLALDSGSNGPAIDQFGRCSDPAYFAAGNVLRPIETAGWCFREGGRIGAAIADDFLAKLPSPAVRLAVVPGSGIKYVAPQTLCVGGPRSGLQDIQLRLTEAVSGVLTVEQGGKTLFRKTVVSRQERRLLVPLAQLALHERGGDVNIAIERGGA